MLNSIRKGGIALATVALFAATAAQAENHNVLIVDGAFFPEIVYVTEGDNVIFTNNSGNAQNVVSENSQWTTGSISIDGRYVLKVRDLVDLTFASLDADGNVMTDIDGVAVAGALSFDAPPELQID